MLGGSTKIATTWGGLYTLRTLSGERPGFFYLRSSNPTTRALELTLAELQGRDDCLVCASGVGAIAQTLLALTKQADHVLCFLESYGPTRYLIRRTLARFGVSHTLLSIGDLDGIENTLATRPTRLVIFESPTNPINRIADIAAITKQRLVSYQSRDSHSGIGPSGAPLLMRTTCDIGPPLPSVAQPLRY